MGEIGPRNQKQKNRQRGNKHRKDPAAEQPAVQQLQSLRPLQILFFIRGRSRGAVGISHFRFLNAGHQGEVFFHSPETASRQVNRF